MSEDISTPTKSGWVKFDDGSAKTPAEATSSGVSSARGSINSINDINQDRASLDVSEVQNVDEHSLRKKSVSESHHALPSRNNENMDNVNLSDDVAVAVQEPRIGGRRFQNGDILVTLLPVNERFPWVTPARFRPELVPEELMAPVLTLTVEEYVQTMEKLTTDMRFTIFNICYKRILVMWIATAFIILLALLFSGFQGIELFACGVLWLILNAGAIFFCMWIKLKLNKQIEKCMSSINASLIKHKLILGVDDRGKISCHKVNLCWIYFEPHECIKKLEAVLTERPEDVAQNGAVFDRDHYLREVERFEDVEVTIAGRNTVKGDKKHERAEKLYLHYVQRWAKDFLRRRLDWVVDDMYGRGEYSSNTNPRHIQSALCPCQYIEEHLRNKRHRESLNPCTWSANPCQWCD